MVKRKKVVNYILTLGFIFLLISFLSSLILISRIVLSDADLQEHVVETKEILQEIEEIEKKTKAFENNTIRKTFNLNSTYVNSRLLEQLLLERYFTNTQKNTSILSFYLNSSIITKENNTYILTTSVEEGEYIITNSSKHFQLISKKGEELTFIDEQGKLFQRQQEPNYMVLLLKK